MLRRGALYNVARFKASLIYVKDRRVHFASLFFCRYFQNLEL